MADSKQIELWKTVVTLGSGVSVAGASILIAASNHASERLEFYGLSLLIGGLVLVLLGLTYAFWQQYEWRRPPKLLKGLVCRDFPLQFDPVKFPNEPHFQTLSIRVHRRFSIPAFRVTCNAPIRRIEGFLVDIAHLIQTVPQPTPPRTLLRCDLAIDSIAFYLVPIEPVEPPAMLHLTVFSGEPIRVRKITKLKTAYRPPPPVAPPETRPMPPQPADPGA